MKAYLLRTLSRRNIFLVGWLTSLGGLLLAGLLAAPFHAIPADLAGGNDPSAPYHFHLAAVLTTGLSILLLLLSGAVSLREAELNTLRESYRQLVLFSLVSLLGGLAVTYGLGWLKEMMDAADGRFASSSDLEANLRGMMTQFGFALVLLLPPQAGVALVGDRLRRWLLLRLTPPRLAEKLERAHGAEDRLHVNERQLDRHGRELDQAERELDRLTVRWRNLTPTQRDGAEGEALRQTIREREEQVRTLVGRLAQLETDNQLLRGELTRLRQEMTAVPEAAGILVEVDVLARRSLAQATRLSGIGVRGEELGERLAQATVPPEELPAMVAAALVEAEPAGPDLEQLQAELGELRREQEERRASEAALAGELGTARAALAEAEARFKAQQAERSAKLEKALAILKRRVMVVDDEEGIRGVFRHSLDTTGLLEVKAVGSVNEALVLMRDQHWLPELMLLDINMPGVDGVEFCGMLEKKDATRHIKVVFCSGRSPESLPQLERLHHVAFLQKPARLREIQDCVLGQLGLRLP